MPLLVRDPTPSVAFAAAASRRRALERHLAQGSESSNALQGFREFPEFGIDRAREAPFLEGPAAAGEYARLRWQLRSSGYLLLERAADWLEVSLRGREKELEAGSLSISLEPLRYSVLRPARPPWRVVIHAPDQLRLDEVFAVNGEALGIGVERRPASHFRAFSRCSLGPDGLDGVVGGVVRRGFHEEYSVTCAHVLASHCGSLEFPRSLPAGPAPDAVLLRRTSCFTDPGPSAQEVFPATESDTARFQLTQAALGLHHPERTRVRGWLKYPVSAVLGTTGALIRFPHYSVQAFRYKLGFLRWPPFANRFARRGDSGSWVLEETSRIWLGMVVQGYDHDSDTIVADGQALLDYYHALITGRVGSRNQNDLAPFTWA